MSAWRSLFADWEPWADPETIAVGRLPMRAPLCAHADADAARRGDRGASPWRIDLGGHWAAARFAHPREIPADAVVPETGTSDWPRIAVPGNWTLQELGDLPHYTNIAMPWRATPPGLPPEIPTVVHRRTFDAPRGWSGRRIVIHVGGAESVHGLWVNGNFAGWGTDSRLASEYDVTEHVIGGTNHVAIVVCRWSAQSYLEDQDQWWMAGLHREVFVEARAPVHIFDVRVGADADTATVRGGSATAEFTLDVEISAPGRPTPGPGWSVQWALETCDGSRVLAEGGAPVEHLVAPYVFTGHCARARAKVRSVALWSAETPVLHRVLVTLVDPLGSAVETVAVRTGFRHVEVRGRDLLVNGERVIIRGVNRHDHSPDRGKAVTDADMRADLAAMKSHNLNALRCAHYPNDPRLLDMCDELGLYVVDEANAESHAHNTSLWRDQRWHASWLARVSRMVTRDRNHPSVILWSLGNEAGYGPVHDSAAAWVRASDPTRPLHYEPAVFHTNWIDGGTAATDVVCPMYSSIDEIVAYGRSGEGCRPLIMCEYSHAMGNSNGSLADYQRAFETVPGLQGGFIWEWKDHALRQRLPDGRVRLAYGGQFGDAPNDANFVADGLMHAEMTPHPAMREVAWVHRPVSVTLRGTGAGARLVVANRRHFTDLSDLEGRWELLCEGEVTRSGRMTVRLRAGETTEVALPCPRPSSGEAHLRITWRSKIVRPWCDAGHLVAWDEVVLRTGSRRPPRTGPAGRQELAAMIEPSLTLWRAPTDNDGMKLAPHLWAMFGRSLERWLDQGIDTADPGTLVRHRHAREARRDGSVLHRHVVTVPRALADLPRVGVRFDLPPGFEHLRWFGEGPHECYPDRRASALTGIWEADPEDCPYLVPQEHGLRTNCRWLEIADDAGRRLRVDAVGTPLHMSALRHGPGDLHRATEMSEVPVRDRLTIHVDVAHRGLGTASCGPDTLPEYRVGTGRFEFAYVVSQV